MAIKAWHFYSIKRVVVAIVVVLALFCDISKTYILKTTFIYKLGLVFIKLKCLIGWQN